MHHHPAQSDGNSTSNHSTSGQRKGSGVVHSTSAQVDVRGSAQLGAPRHGTTVDTISCRKAAPLTSTSAWLADKVEQVCGAPSRQMLLSRSLYPVPYHSNTPSA
jgi:hypothetical protein